MTTRIAIHEGSIPKGAEAGLRDLGYSLWMLPRGEAADTRRLIREFPPDVVILPMAPQAAEVARSLSAELPAVRVLAVADPTPELEVQPDWADLVVPSASDPVLWMLSVLALRPTSGPAEHGPAGWRQTLLSVIDRTHQAIQAMGGRRAAPDKLATELRARLEESFGLLLKLLLDRLERDIEGFAGQSGRVASLSRQLAASLGLSKEDVESAALAGLLHDLGMHLVLPTQALRRPGPLHLGEREVLRAHPIASAAILSPLSETGTVTTAIREHHERLDGSGYPIGKRGEQVSVGARIVTVADAFEAMTHPRPHRQALSADEALESLRAEGSAGRLDSEICMALSSVAPANGPGAPSPKEEGR